MPNEITGSTGPGFVERESPMKRGLKFLVLAVLSVLLRG
jgi:hypothetical protein